MPCHTFHPIIRTVMRTRGGIKIIEPVTSPLFSFFCGRPKKSANSLSFQFWREKVATPANLANNVHSPIEKNSSHLSTYHPTSSSSISSLTHLETCCITKHLNHCLQQIMMQVDPYALLSEHHHDHEIYSKALIAQISVVVQ